MYTVYGQKYVNTWLWFFCHKGKSAQLHMTSSHAMELRFSFPGGLIMFRHDNAVMYKPALGYSPKGQRFDRQLLSKALKPALS